MAFDFFNPFKVVSDVVKSAADALSKGFANISTSGVKTPPPESRISPGAGSSGGSAGGGSEPAYKPPEPKPAPKPEPGSWAASGHSTRDYSTPAPQPKPEPKPEPVPQSVGRLMVVADPSSNPEIKMFLIPGRGSPTVDLTPQGRVRLSTFESGFEVPAGLIQVTLYRGGGQIFKQATVPANGVGRIVFDPLPSATPEPVAPTLPPQPAPPPFIGVGRAISLQVPLRVVKGQDIPISAKVFLATTPISPSDGEPVELVVADQVVATSTTRDGVVAFDWTVPEDAPLTFKICLRIPANDIHPEYADSIACKVVSATREFTGVAEQKLSEMEEYLERLAALRAERVRQLESQRVDPSTVLPGVVPGSSPPEIPIPEIPVPDIPPPEPPALGEIRIPFVDIGKPGPFPDPKIYIDNQYAGAPPLSVAKEPGKHVVKVELKGFAPLHKTVQVEPGGAVILDNLSLR